jgi:sugar phosphate isomerase/epimerase
VNTSTISLQLYTLRDAIAADLRGTLERVAGFGYTQVEPYDFVARADEFAEAFAAFGLSAPSAHALFLSTDDVDEIFATAARLGIGTVIDPFLGADRWTTRADIEAIATQLNGLVAVAAAHGIRIGYHNHFWELDQKIDGETALEVFAALLDPAVVLEVDTYWSAVGGQPAPALLERLGDRVRFIHVKDGPISMDTKAQTAVGGGASPIAEILAAAPQALRVVELDDFDGDVFDAVRDSLAFLVAAGEQA